jgi:plasmid stability protein
VTVNDGEKTVSFRVFLSDDERTQLKVQCAKRKTTMSQQCRELIREWLSQQNEPLTTSSSAKGRGKKVKDE